MLPIGGFKRQGGVHLNPFTFSLLFSIRQIFVCTFVYSTCTKKRPNSELSDNANCTSSWVPGERMKQKKKPVQLIGVGTRTRHARHSRQSRDILDCDLYQPFSAQHNKSFKKLAPRQRLHAGSSANRSESRTEVSTGGVLREPRRTSE